ncbi:MAG: DNA polymerase III subunit delta [Spirochaetaceae bacterium]|jgi:DNA polymerase-3 subunit delta|nr:DNA polymerase III subunit delta [Spirochaetaceae bacterium]
MNNGIIANGENFLFLGPELGEKQDAVNRIRVEMTAKHGSPPEETSFYAGDTPAADIISFLLNASLFSSARLILVKNAELLKKKEDAASFAAYLKAPARDATLILISDAVSIDKTIENAVPKSAKHIFWEMFENKKPEWVRSYFRREGFSVDEDAVNAILELVENNTGALRQECSRLALFAGGKNGGKSAITAAEVEKWLSHTRCESAFTLFSALACGNLSKSVEILNALLAAQETSVSIIAGLTWCFRRFRDYCELAARGETSDFELKKIGIATAKGRRDYADAERTFGLNAADVFLDISAEYDLAAREGGAAVESILLHIYLYKLWSLRKRPPARSLKTAIRA